MNHIQFYQQILGDIRPWRVASVAVDHAALKASTLKTAKAWTIKELWREFRRCAGVEDARGYFRRWYALAMRTRLGPVIKVARMFREHLEPILSYFRHLLTNAGAEGLNSRIQHLITRARGYRNRERLKRSLFFHLGGLDLYPR